MRYFLFSLLFILCACNKESGTQDKLLDEGVSWELAEYRKASMKDLRYDLHFSIPADKDKDIEARETISFCLDKVQDVILDFREDAEKILGISANGSQCPVNYRNEHLIIDAGMLKVGTNEIKIEFIAGNQSLNRRDDYIYTLFVPDRARTVFPCIEQPNMKALFRLSLEVPSEWKAVSNAVLENTVEASEGRSTLTFAETEPLPTYLFAFCAGRFDYKRYEEDDRSIGIYYRETDPARLAQLDDIGRQVVFSLKWLEDFTAVPFPFQKYDLIILPGFQFGGMEHTGATFYNDNTLFLSANPTPDEQLRRTELISHETAHMWFGDAVTMNWFDDVWTKEVFANYFAAQITAPLFPEINHDLNFLKTYVAAAMSEDRTEGATPIRQALDNMRYAGLVYNNIIYNKAPVMMSKLVEVMGKDAFQRGIRKYVRTYLYGNATWDDLVAILDAETPEDLNEFSQTWVYGKGMPTYTLTADNALKEYGYYTTEYDVELHSYLDGWSSMPNGTAAEKTARQAMLMTLHENYLNRRLSDREWLSSLVAWLCSETDALTASTIIGYLSEPVLLMPVEETEVFEGTLMDLSQSHVLPSVRTQLLRFLYASGKSKATTGYIKELWTNANHQMLSERDYMSMAYELAMRLPEESEEIIRTQQARLTNADRRTEFDYISRAVVADQAACDSVFEFLKKPENRRIEPWALKVLYYLNHPMRQDYAVKYIYPALELLPEIQRTGDIFFPGNWCRTLLSGHRSAEALREVDRFLDSHKDYPQLLTNKILLGKYYVSR